MITKIRPIVFKVSVPDPYNPLDLPQYTMRIKLREYNPYVIYDWPENVTNIQWVDTTNALMDVTTSDSNWTNLLSGPCYDVIEIVGANAAGVTNMSGMFYNCTGLTTIPLLDTSAAEYVDYMWYGCTNVQSGALALYNQMSTQTTPPESHYATFYNCGSNTTTGAAELAQIPSGWKDE